MPEDRVVIEPDTTYEYRCNYIERDSQVERWILVEAGDVVEAMDEANKKLNTAVLYYTGVYRV